MNIEKTREMQSLTWKPKLYIFNIISMENSTMKNMFVISGEKRRELALRNVLLKAPGRFIIKVNNKSTLFPRSSDDIYLESCPTSAADCSAPWREHRYSRRLELWWANRRPGTSQLSYKLFASACSLCEYSHHNALCSLNFTLAHIHKRLKNLWACQISDDMISTDIFSIRIKVFQRKNFLISIIEFRRDICDNDYRERSIIY